MKVRVGFVLGVSAAGGALVLGTLLGLQQFDSGKRLLIRLLDKTPAPVAAASVVGTLQPRFDGADETRRQIPVTLVPVIHGVAQPTDVAMVPGHPQAAVVLSKTGTAHLVDLAEGGRQIWLQIAVATTSELGLLGIAFHPGFADNGRFWVNATPSRGGQRAATVITEFHVDPHTLLDPQRVADILEVAQPYQNHNAGQLAFGPDGMLYIGLGDGGFRDDPLGAGQDRSTLLGSLLRLDVAEPGHYRVPPSNPFVGEAGVRPEIWAYGLRNPWRFAFDPRGRLVVADVGQNLWEEIDLVAAGSNLGWRVREGAHCFDPADGCPTAGLVDPIWDYPRDEGQSVTGGVVCTAPGPLQGRYLFGDFVSGRLWALDLPDTPVRASEVVALGRFDVSPSAFTRDVQGRVWVADFRRGAVFRIEPEIP